MAAISFPSSPTTNQIHTVGARSWKYNGTAWKLVPRTTDAVVEGSTNLYYTPARVASAPAVTALEGRASAIEGDITAIESAATTLAGRVTTAEGDIAAVNTRVDNVLSNVDGTALNSLSEIVTAFQQADSDLNGAITSLASSASTGLTNEVNRATAAEGALAGRATALEGRATSVEGSLSGHIANTENPHSVTKAQVGLGNVDNTSDANKPVSSATQTALDGKQIKDFISENAPSHVEGRRWVDSSDMTEYVSYNGAWVELDKQ